MTLRPPIDLRGAAGASEEGKGKKAGKGRFGLEEEVFGSIGEGKLDEEMVELAGLIIDRRAGKFAPESFEDRYQTALRRLIEAKLRGEKLELPPAPTPAKVIDLKDVLRRAAKAEGAAPPERRRRAGGRR